MKKNKEYTGMPLRLWVMSAIVALATLIFLYLLFAFTDIQPNTNREKALREKSHSYNLNKNVDVYFIGSSLSRGALFAFNSLENSILKNDKRFNFKIIVGNGFSLDEFNYKIREIKALQPKYLFIESNLACIDIFRNPFLGFRHRLSRLAFDLINISNLVKLNDDFLVNNFNRQIDPDPKADKKNRDAELQIRIRGINEFYLWNKFFKEAEELGIKIYLLEVPRSAEAERHLPGSVKQQFNYLVDKYNTEYNVGFIGFHEKLSFTKYYVDGAHFNKLGADYYSDWLVNEIFKRELLK